MFKNLILILICLLMLNSCGRKNDPQYEASLNNNQLIFKDSYKLFKTQEENEIY